MIYANNDSRVCQLLLPFSMKPEQVPWVMKRLERAIGDVYKQLDATK